MEGGIIKRLLHMGLNRYSQQVHCGDTILWILAKKSRTQLYY